MYAPTTGLVGSYLEYTRHVPSPPIFRLWAAIHAIGSAAERRVWTGQGLNRLYPNLFVFLVGPPGVGKTQALRHIEPLIRKSKAVTLAPNDVSKQGLLDCLETASRGAILDGRPFDYHFLDLHISELTNFMSQYDSALAGLLTDLWDCKEVNEELKRMMGKKSAVINSPGVSMIVGTATRGLGEVIPAPMWNSGFMARVILVFSAEGVLLDDLFTVHEFQQELADDITNGLARIGEFTGPMGWTADAQQLLNDFYRRPGGPVHNRLAEYNTRRWMHLAKLCMIAALSELRMTITGEDFAVAHSWLTMAEAEMTEIFKDMTHHEDGLIFEELRRDLFNIYLAAGYKPLHVTVVAKWLSTRVSGPNVARMIQVAELAGYINRVAGTDGDDALYVPQMTKDPKATKGVI